MNASCDILIVGGGIQGAGCAQAAAAAGYRVTVLEKYARPGLGTSCRSSKLIHGGLRYLETAQFRLVHECLHERSLLLRNAPHLVTLKPFHIPVYKNSTRSPWTIWSGLALYALLSGKGFSRVPKRKWAELDGLNTEDLLAVYRYYDGQTDDQRLTASVMRSAQQLGAEFIPCAEMISAQCGSDACEVLYRQDGGQKRIVTSVLVNAAGPWANRVLQRVTPRPLQADIELVLGSHIVVPGTLEQGMYYMEAPQDRRAVFVLSQPDGIMIGTTETVFHGTPDRVEPPESDIEYLMDVYNHYFRHTLCRADVKRAFAGLRVLPAGGEAFNRPRDILIQQDAVNPRVLTIYGGKLTAYRATAERVIRQVAMLLPRRRRQADVKRLRLP